MTIWAEIANTVTSTATGNVTSLIASAPKLVVAAGLALSVPTQLVASEPFDNSNDPRVLADTLISATMEKAIHVEYISVADSNAISVPATVVVNKSETPRTNLTEAYQQLQGFRDLQDGWDGYGSEAPVDATISNSMRLLDEWGRNLHVNLDVDLGVLHDGGISFELYSPVTSKLLGAVDVFADGELSYAMSIGGIGNRLGSLVLDSRSDRSKLFEVIKEAIEIL